MWLRWKGVGGGRGRFGSPSTAVSVLDSIRATLFDRLRNLSPDLGSCGAARVGLRLVPLLRLNDFSFRELLDWNDLSVVIMLC